MFQQAKTRFKEMRRRVPLLYVCMMVLTGMSIGAITALSKTSVTNTLIEVVVVFISGSAGLYFLNRENLETEGAAISAIGGVGILFLLSFWLAFLVLDLASPQRTLYAPWSNDKTLAENLALVESRGHLARLGVDPDVVARPGEVEGALPPAAAGDCLAEGDARGFARMASRLYSQAIRDECYEELTTVRAASFLEADFKRVLSGELRENTAEHTQFDAASAALLALAAREPDLARAGRLTCGSPEMPDPDAITLARRVALCRDAPTVRRLHLIRDHAAAFQDVWGDPVAVETVRTGIVMETLRNDGTDTDP